MMQVWTQIYQDGKVDSYDYNIECGEDSFSLKRSNSSFWSNPGEEVGSIEDDGEFINIVLGKRKLKLDYSQAEQLLILLKIVYNGKLEIRECKTIKSE